MKHLLLIATLVLFTSCIAQRNTFKNVTEKDGKIGIGTTSPDALLTVKGKIHAQEVLIDLEGAVAPDYVFEYYFEGVSKLNPDYKAWSLSEIEAFVKKYHHLPNVPSAKELEKEGFLLKEMNLLLLEKIEELTIFTIEQQKEIEKLKEKIASLEK